MIAVNIIMQTIKNIKKTARSASVSRLFAVFFTLFFSSATPTACWLQPNYKLRKNQRLYATEIQWYVLNIHYSETAFHKKSSILSLLFQPTAFFKTLFTTLFGQYIILSLFTIIVNRFFSPKSKLTKN